MIVSLLSVTPLTFFQSCHFLYHFYSLVSSQIVLNLAKNRAIKIKAIQVGVSGNYGGHWLRVLDEYPGVNVVGLVGIAKPIMAKASERHEISSHFCT